MHRAHRRGRSESGRHSRRPGPTEPPARRLSPVHLGLQQERHRAARQSHVVERRREQRQDPALHPAVQHLVQPERVDGRDGEPAAGGQRLGGELHGRRDDPSAARQKVRDVPDEPHSGHAERPQLSHLLLGQLHLPHEGRESLGRVGSQHDAHRHVLHESVPTCQTADRGQSLR